MSMSLTWSVLVLTALVACGDKDDDDDTAAGGTDGGATTTDDGIHDCWTTRPDECAATPGCVELTAREVVADGTGGWCVDYGAAPVVYGCMPADVDCGAAMSYATPPALPESCFEFSSTCTVAGWGSCADDAMTSPGECAR